MMANETDDMYSGESLPAASAAVLLVVGEPISPEHKDLILSEISKGFLSWDVEGTGVDINEELASIANRASLGEEGPEAPPYGPLKGGERVIRHSSEAVLVEVLVNPQTCTVRKGLKTILTTPSPHKLIVYAGHGFQGSGSWVLQDDSFTFANFAQVFRDPDVENALKQQQGGSLSIRCFAEGEWSNGNIAKQDFGKTLKISVNPDERLSDSNGIIRFITYVSSFVEGRSLNKLLQASDVVGNIRFSKPTLYIFPGCQGDSALFGISGFNLLVNGGYNRKACFWDFTRHLDRIDALLLTHIGTDNLFGIGSVLERKAVENVHPEIGYIYLNASEKSKHSPNGDMAPEDGGLLKPSTLKINLSEECNRMVEYCKVIGQAPHPCTRPATTQTLDPINLYHKVGHGSLDLYILNPVQDSREIKEFFQQWSKSAGQFGSPQGFPLQNVLSTCALLVWKPANPAESITRIFFPGNAPQSKVIEGLEKVKNLDFLKVAKCCDRDLHTKPGKKGSAPMRAARPVSSKPISSPRETVKKERLDRAEKLKTAPSSSKANKGIKEDTNKKAVREKRDKQKSPASPSKSSTPNGTPASSLTPSLTPARLASPPEGVGAERLVDQDLISIPQSAEPLVQEEQTSTGSASLTEDSKAEAEQDLLNQIPATDTGMPAIQPLALESQTSKQMESPEPLPDPHTFDPGSVIMPVKEEETMAMVDEQVAMSMSRKTMEELGIYDEDFVEDEVQPQQQQPHEMPVEQPLMNDDHVEDATGEDEEPEGNAGAFENDNPEAEEIQPEALPEPIAVPPYYPASPDVIPEQISEEKEKDTGLQEESQPDLEEFSNQQQVPEIGTPPKSPVTEIIDVADESALQSSLPSETPLMAEADPSLPDVMSDYSVSQTETVDNESGACDVGVPSIQLSEDEPGVDENILDDANEGTFEGKNEVGYDESTAQIQGAEDHFQGDEASMEEIARYDNFQTTELSDREESPNFGFDAAEGHGRVEAADFTETQGRSSEMEPSDFDAAEEQISQPEACNTGFEAAEPAQFQLSTFDEDRMDNQHTQLEDMEESTIPAAFEKDDTPTRTEVAEASAPSYEPRPETSSLLNLDSGEIAHLVAVDPLPDFGQIDVNAAGDQPLDFEQGSDHDDHLQNFEHGGSQGFGLIGSQDFEHGGNQGFGLVGSQDFERGGNQGFGLVGSQDFEHGGNQGFGLVGSQDFQQGDEQNLQQDADMNHQGRDLDLQPGSEQLQDFEHREETDSLDEDAVDDEKDIDEACEPENEDCESGNEDINPSLGNQETNPFMMDDQPPPDTNSPLEQGGMNPFFGIDATQKAMAPDTTESPFTDDFPQEQAQQPFNPLKEWGEPMGLPSPMMEEAASNGPVNEPKQNGDKSPKTKTSKTAKNGPSKPTDSRAGKKEPKKAASLLSKTQPKTDKKAPTPTTAKSQRVVNGDAKVSPRSEKKAASTLKSTTNAAGTKPSPRNARPATAPSRTDNKKATEKADVPKSDLKTKPPTRRPATATGSRSAPAVKAVPLPPVTAFYVDLTYIPAHGDSKYSDMEFFRRVRARYYVLSTLSPNLQTLNSLLEAKQVWEDKELEVTIIPTYDNETLRHWMGLHKEHLNELKIDVAPAASRCTIQLQDHETSCSAYRLEF